MLPPIIAKLSALVQKRARIERRRARRVSPGSLTPCLLRATAEARPHEGWLHNLSVRGAGMLIDRAYPTGTTVQVLLVNGGHTFSLSLELEIVRCFKVVNGDFFLGGKFTRDLTYEELAPFLL
jgi:hypothetical protein